jgi:hypothetical protein
MSPCPCSRTCAAEDGPRAGTGNAALTDVQSVLPSPARGQFMESDAEIAEKINELLGVVAALKAYVAAPTGSRP